MMGGKFEAVSLLNAYAAEVASVSEDAALPARVLRRRVAEHSSHQQQKEKLFSPMIGREIQLAQFVGALNSARSGFGSSHLIAGPAGVGKSRLLEEVTSLATLSGFSVARVAVNDGDSEQPVHLLFRLFPLLLECRGAIGCNPTSLQLLRSLSDGQQPEIEHSGNADLALGKRTAIFRAVVDLCVAIADETALLLAVDNLHKLDANSISLLEYVGAALTGHKFVVICCTRTSADCSPAINASLVTFGTCQLTELSVSDSLTYIDAIATERRIDEATRRSLYDCAGGNPLHLELVVAHYLATGKLSPPAGVRSAVAARLSRCTVDELRVLQVISLAERNATVLLVEFASMLGPAELMHALDGLENAELISVQDDRLAARHELIRDDALSRLGPASRMYIHRRIAEEIDRRFDSDATPLTAWARVRHWVAAGEVDRAASALRSCIVSTTCVGLPAEASDLATTALRACQSDFSRGAIYEPLVHALHEAGRWEEILRVDESLRSYGQGHSTESTTEIVRLFAEFRVHGNSDHTMSALVDSIKNINRPQRHRISAAEFGLRIADMNGDRPMMTRLYGIIGSSVEIAPADDYTAICFLTIYHTSCGSLESARNLAERLMVAADSCTNPVVASRLLRYASVALERSSTAASALEPLIAAQEIGTRLGSDFIEAVSSVRLLQIALGAGYDQLADEAFETLQRTKRAGRDHITAEGSLGTTARFLIERGNAAKARTLLSASHRTLKEMPLRHRAELSAAAAHAALECSDNRAAVKFARICASTSAALASLGGFDYPAAVLTLLQANGLVGMSDWEGWQHYLPLRREAEKPGAGILGVATGQERH